VAAAGEFPRTGGAPSHRRYVAVWGALLGVAGVAWAVTIVQARGMGTGPGTMGLSLPLFLLFWVVMMAAMMFPSVAPMAIVWTRSISSRETRPQRAGGLTLFLTGYLVVWAGFGAVAFVALLGAGRLVDTAPRGAVWAGAAIFAVAGLYQLTPLKDVCLRHCRSPIGSLFHYASYTGSTRDLRVGMHHGAFCVGCCWGLMILLVAVGVMNIAVMAALAVVVLLEKVWVRGPLLARAVGVALLVAAVLAPWHPWLLPGLRAAPMMSGMN